MVTTSNSKTPQDQESLAPQENVAIPKNKKSFFKKFGQIGKIVAGLTAAGSLVGLLITLYNWKQEQPDLDIRISEIDLISYIPESQEKVFQNEIANAVIELYETHRYTYKAGDYLIPLLESIYELNNSLDRIAVKHPEQGDEEMNLLEDVKSNFSESIKNLKDQRESLNSEDNKEKYGQMIERMEAIQTNFEKITPKDKLSLQVSFENSSRLSNYIDPQGILMFYKDETSYAAVPQIVMNLTNESDVPDAGKVEGYGVSSVVLEAEIDDLEVDDKNYVDFAFQGRANGDETYNLMFAIEDIQGRMWFEKALFSTFTERKLKQELKSKAEKVFNQNHR